MIHWFNDTTFNNTTVQLFTTFAFIFNFQRYKDTALYNFCFCFCFLLSNHSRFKISAFVQLLLLTFALALFPFDIAIIPLWLWATFLILFPVWLLWHCISLNHQALFLILIHFFLFHSIPPYIEIQTLRSMYNVLLSFCFLLSLSLVSSWLCEVTHRLTYFKVC